MKKEKGLSRKMLNWKWMFVLAMLCFTVLGCGMKSEAAAKLRKLQVGKSYTTKLTGSEYHRIKFKYKKGNESYNTSAIKIFVDGKRVKTVKQSAFNWYVYLCEVSENQTLLCIRDNTDNDYNECLKVFEYKNSKMKQIADLAGMTRSDTTELLDKTIGGWSRGTIQKVKNNKLVVRWCCIGRATGIYYIDVPYKVTGSVVTQGKGAYPIKNSDNAKIWTATRRFYAYTTAAGTKLSFQVNAGDKVTPLKMRTKNGKIYFQIRNAAGVKGWFKDAETYSEAAYFEEAVFAG